MLNRIAWYFKQLLPLTYTSVYGDVESDKKYVSIWKMFLGKVYKHRCYQVVNEV